MASPSLREDASCARQRMPMMTYNERKWSILYHYFDVKKDGILELEEFMTFPKRLIELGKLDHGNFLKSLYESVWKKLCDVNSISDGRRSLSEAQFIQACEILRTSDQWFQSTFVPGIADVYFDSLDRNNDGHISVEEWTVYQNNRGVNDDKVIWATFNRLDTDGDGEISREEMRHAVIQFNLGDDPADDYSFLYDLSITKF